MASENKPTEEQIRRRDRNMRYRNKTRQLGGKKFEIESDRQIETGSVIDIKRGQNNSTEVEKDSKNPKNKEWEKSIDRIDVDLSDIKIRNKKSFYDMKQKIENMTAIFTSAAHQSEILQAGLIEKSQTAIFDVKAEVQASINSLAANIDDMRQKIENMTAAFTLAAHQTEILQAGLLENSQSAIFDVKAEVQASINSLAANIDKITPSNAYGKKSTSDPAKVNLQSFAWQDFSILLKSPSAFFLTVAVLAITGLLVFFQTSAYITGGLGIASLPIAATCELSLIAITIFFSAKMQRKTAVFLFLAVFVYVLATMIYDLASTSSQEVTTATTNNRQTALIEAQLETYIESLQTATKKQENGNMAKWSSKIDDAKRELSRLQTTAKNSDTVRLIEAKCYGMIVLRALLMLINAFFVHALIGIFKRNSEQVIAI